MLNIFKNPWFKVLRYPHVYLEHRKYVPLYTQIRDVQMSINDICQQQDYQSFIDSVSKAAIDYHQLRRSLDDKQIRLLSKWGLPVEILDQMGRAVAHSERIASKLKKKHSSLSPYLRQKFEDDTEEQLRTARIEGIYAEAAERAKGTPFEHPDSEADAA